MAELSYLFTDCDNGNEHHCNVLGIDVSFLHDNYVYTSPEYGCVTFQKKSEEPPTETITITDGVFVDCNSCAAVKHVQAYHFRKGCSEEEYEDIWVIDTGNLKPKEYAYYQDLYNGCWQYIGYDDVGITGQFLDYMEFNQTPYDNCHCSQMFDAYLFKDCDGNEKYFKTNGTFDIGKSYFEKNTGVCCEFIGNTQITYEPTVEFIDGGECNCYKYMIFETCDGKHKFYTSLDYMLSIPDLQYEDKISLTDDPCGPRPEWIYAYLGEGGSYSCYLERIEKLQSEKIDFELYVNCFKFLRFVQEIPSDIEEYPWRVYRIDPKCASECCEIFFFCSCKLCGSDEQIELFLSNTIINTINNSDYNVFVTKNGKYTIDEINYNDSAICEKKELHEEDFVYATDVIKYLESCEEEETCELTIKPKHCDVEYYERVNCEFASAVFNEAMSERYGVEFCCKKDLQRLTIKKKLLDAGALQDDVDLCKCEI